MSQERKKYLTLGVDRKMDQINAGLHGEALPKDQRMDDIFGQTLGLPVAIPPLDPQARESLVKAAKKVSWKEINKDTHGHEAPDPELERASEQSRDRLIKQLGIKLEI